MGNNQSCVPCSRSDPHAMQPREPQALLTMPDMTLHEIGARLQTMTEPLNMQGQEIINSLARGAMHAANVPMPEFKDVTDEDKQDALMFLAPAAWTEFVNRIGMEDGRMLWCCSRCE